MQPSKTARQIAVLSTLAEAVRAQARETRMRLDIRHADLWVGAETVAAALDILARSMNPTHGSQADREALLDQAWDEADAAAEHANAFYAPENVGELPLQ